MPSDPSAPSPNSRGQGSSRLYRQFLSQQREIEALKRKLAVAESDERRSALSRHKCIARERSHSQALLESKDRAREQGQRLYQLRKALSHQQRENDRILSSNRRSLEHESSLRQILTSLRRRASPEANSFAEAEAGRRNISLPPRPDFIDSAPARLVPQDQHTPPRQRPLVFDAQPSRSNLEQRIAALERSTPDFFVGEVEVISSPPEYSLSRTYRQALEDFTRNQFFLPATGIALFSVLLVRAAVHKYGGD